MRASSGSAWRSTSRRAARRETVFDAVGGRTRRTARELAHGHQSGGGERLQHLLLAGEQPELAEPVAHPAAMQPRRLDQGPADALRPRMLHRSLHGAPSSIRAASPWRRGRDRSMTERRNVRAEDQRPRDRPLDALPGTRAASVSASAGSCRRGRDSGAAPGGRRARAACASRILRGGSPIEDGAPARRPIGGRPPRASCRWVRLGVASPFSSWKLTPGQEDAVEKALQDRRKAEIPDREDEDQRLGAARAARHRVRDAAPVVAGCRDSSAARRGTGPGRSPRRRGRNRRPRARPRAASRPPLRCSAATKLSGRDGRRGRGRASATPPHAACCARPRNRKVLPER